MHIIFFIMLIGAICFLGRLIVLLFKGLTKIFPIIVIIIIGIMIMMAFAH